MKADWSYSGKARAAAAVLAAVVLVFGTLWAVHRTAAKLALEVQTAFLTGTDGTGYGIGSDLQSRLDYTSVLIKLARSSSVSEADLQSVIDARDALDRDVAGTDYAKTAQDDAALTDAVYALDALLEKSGEKDDKWTRELANFDSKSMTIAHAEAGFNEKVSEYNETVSQLPAGLIAGLAGVKKLEVYG